MEHTDNRKFYYREWKEAEVSGNVKYANACKDKYRDIVIESLKKPYNMYIQELKQFPMIYLN